MLRSTGPLPVAAYLIAGTGLCACLFDRYLGPSRPAPLTPIFTVRAGFVWEWSDIHVAGDAVAGSAARADPTLLAEGTYYAPPPYELGTPDGLRVEAFEAFPTSFA